MAAHEKLLEKMRASTAGWGQHDFQRLYEGYGFLRREGGNHTFYSHADFPQLTATVARHNELPNVYAQTALTLLDQLLKLQEQKRAEEQTPAAPMRAKTVSQETRPRKRRSKSRRKK